MSIRSTETILSSVKEADRIVIKYYADPLCCTYCMDGLISDWKNYQDPMNDISRPGLLSKEKVLSTIHLLGRS